MKFRWNSTQNNWIGSKNAPKEVGSIYTVQGDDLNYVGIIIGNDLIYRDGKLVFNRKACADSGAMKRSQRQVANNEQIDECVEIEKFVEKQINDKLKVFYTTEKTQKLLEKYEIYGEFVKNNIISAFNLKIQNGESVNLNQIYPVYLRASQAEIEREKKKNNG